MAAHVAGFAVGVVGRLRCCTAGRRGPSHGVADESHAAVRCQTVSRPSGDAPIGMFDSGVGGLTVARAVLDQLPHESLHYVGDTGPRAVRAAADRRRAPLRPGRDGLRWSPPA